MGKADRTPGLPAGVGKPSSSRSDSRVRRRAPSGSFASPSPVNKTGAGARAAVLVDELVASRRHDIAPVVRRLLPLGDQALDELTVRFPGDLWVAPADSLRSLPAPEDISAIAAALATFNVEAVPYVIRLLSDADSETRYCAAAVASHLQNPRFLGPLVRLATDAERICRRASVSAIATYREAPDYDDAVGGLRRFAANENADVAQRRYAITALTQLRDPLAIRGLVDLLDNQDETLAATAKVALEILTGEKFGRSRGAWLRWLAERAHA